MTEVEKPGLNVLLYNVRMVLKIVFLWPSMFKTVRDPDGNVIGFRGDTDFFDSEEEKE